MAIKVLIIDSQPLYIEGLASVLERDNRFVVVGKASSAGQALTLARHAPPDIAILDIDMPVTRGLIAGPAVVAKLRVIGGIGAVKVIILTMVRDDEALRHCFFHGAAAYLLKDIDARDLAETIIAVSRGKVLISAGVNAQALTRVPLADTPDTAPKLKLTYREKQVLAMVAAGSSSRGIGRRLNISVRTVETHRLRLMRKLRARNAAGLVREALRQRLLED